MTSKRGQRQINVRQRRSNVVIFNIEFHNVGQPRNNIVKKTISKTNKKIISSWIHWIPTFNYYFITFFTLFPTLQKKWSFPLRISSVNVTKSAMENFIFCAVKNKKTDSKRLFLWKMKIIITDVSNFFAFMQE